MIAYLEGKIIKKNFDSLIVSCSGVGYKLQTLFTTLDEVELGSIVEFYIYEQIRENIYELFGFKQENQLEMFNKLLTVNGVGPKMALSILNLASVAELGQAIASADAKFIQKANGVGKKLADKIILELAGRLSKTALINDLDGASVGSKLEEDDEVIEALISLGYNQKQALGMIGKLDTSLSTEQKIRAILSGNI
jgi:Holliday junction DNA helicase RuvA